MKKTTNFLILIFFLFTYLFFAGKFHSSFAITKYNYFNYLAESFLHGKTYLISLPSTTLDLSFFEEKYYLYWPPVPAILITPLIFFTGTNFSDIFYTSFIGGLNCFIFYLLLKELVKTKLVSFSEKTILLSAIFFGFGTVHFYLSMQGSVWFTCQITALFCFLISLWLIIKYSLKNSKSILFISAVFWSLAVFSKLTYVLSIPFFLAVILYLKNSNHYVLKKVNIKNLTKTVRKNFNFLLIFLIPLIFGGILYACYNSIRFQSVFETGYHYHLMSTIHTPSFEKYGLFNIHYIPRNIYFNFLNPLTFSNAFPFVKPNWWGNSLFFTSPLMIYLFKNNLFGKKIKPKTKIFNLVVLTTAVLMAAPALLLFGTGYIQFGSRYYLNILPFLIILVIQNVNNFKKLFPAILLIASCFINIMGNFWYDKFW